MANNLYGFIGLIVYLFVYTLMNMGAFGIIISLRRRGIIGDNVDDLTGLGDKAPVMAAMMSIFMLSLGGLPVTGGFIGKYFLFGGLIERGRVEGKAWYYWLAIWAIINTVVSFYYYFRFIKVMYLGDRIADTKPLALSPALQTALIVSVLSVVDRSLSATTRPRNAGSGCHVRIVQLVPPRCTSTTSSPHSPAGLASNRC